MYKHGVGRPSTTWTSDIMQNTKSVDALNNGGGRVK